MSAVQLLHKAPDACDPAVNLYKIAKSYRRHLQECEDMMPGLQPAGPGWIMLTELFIANVEDRKISVSGVCVSAGVPSTTGLRYLDMLAGRGLVVRAPDERDRRRSWIYLTDAGIKAVEHILSGFVTAVSID